MAGETRRRTLVKRSVQVSGHGTSVALEGEFWDEMERLASREGLSLADLIGRIDRERDSPNLSSALRLHVLRALRAERDGARPSEA